MGFLNNLFSKGNKIAFDGCFSASEQKEIRKALEHVKNYNVLTAEDLTDLALDVRTKCSLYWAEVVLTVEDNTLHVGIA